MFIYYGFFPCITLHQARLPPTVDFEADSSSLWTLILTNPDGHFQEKDSEYLHWFM